MAAHNQPYILHVITTISKGGAENHLVELIRHQLHKGNEVGVAYLKGTPHWRSHIEALGARVFDLKLRFYGDARPFFILRRLLKERKPTLVHAHLPPAELYARLALIGLTGSYFIVSKHNDAPFYGGIGSDLLGRWVAGRADKIIGISKAVTESVLTKALHAPSSKARTIYYGIKVSGFADVSSDKISRLRNSWNCGSLGTVVFGCVARLVLQKDHSTLLRAFAALRQQSAESARLVLVGDGPLLGEIIELRGRLGLDQAVIMAGHRDDICEVMSSIDVLCLPSRYEGFGLVLIEAMAAARPVVATDVSSIPEIVQHGETGLLVPKGNPSALANAMAVMLDKGTRERMGNAGRKRVIEQFTLEKMLSATDEVYAELGLARAGHE